MTDEVTVVDLDGTLLTGNSYRVMLNAMLGWRPASATEVLPYLRLVAVCGLRAARLLARIPAKRQTQKIFAGMIATHPARAQQLGEQLLGVVDPEVMARIAEQLADGVVVLSTAAYPEYVLPLAQRLGFERVITTSSAHAQPWVENLGESKRQLTLAYLKDQGLDGRSRHLIADHDDDVALALACTRTTWIHRSGETLSDRQLTCPGAVVWAR